MLCKTRNSDSSEDLIDLKSKDIKVLRLEILKEQNYICPLCKKRITEDDRITLDHQHKYKKSDENGVDGNGLIRGVLCAECNACEGKVFNAISRFLRHPNKQERIKWLENLINYYKQDPYPYIHPTEVKQEPLLSKRNFNKLKKLYNNKYNKDLEFPKSQKMTKALKPLYEEFNISPYKD